MDGPVVKRRIWWGFFIATVTAFTGAWMLLERSMPQSLPTYAQIKNSHQPSDLFLLDRHGKPLHQWRQDRSERSFLWVALKDISPALKEAVLKSEDKDFFSHGGFDFRALVASLYQRLRYGSPRGGSTISMQLLKILSNDRGVYARTLGKLRQIVMSQRLEAQWSKEEILEAYLNLVPFRREYRGVSSVVWAYFGKWPSGITKIEATLLSVLIRAPNAKTEEWIQRACWQEALLCDEFKSQVSLLVRQVPSLLRHQQALHLAQRLSRSGARGELVTSIEADLQKYVHEVVASQIRELASQNVQEAAVLVLENKTGQVWAYVGGNGQDMTRTYVDGVQALRQAGSTLKPFLYATAFEKNLLHEDSWIEDSPVDIVFERGVYKPQNHDRQFYGWVRVKKALGSSLNVPAVKVFKLLNDDAFWGKLQALNFRSLKDPDHYGPALALGVADVTLEDLTQGYRMLAQNGEYSSLRYDLGEEPLGAKRVFSEESVKEVTRILSSNENRTLGFGLDSVLELPGAAVKTGTSKDMRDNWCVGFNDRFTVGVWLGNFSGAPMWNVLGVTGAAPIWKKVMLWLNDKYPAAHLPLAQRSPRESQTHPEKYPQIRITYPQDGTVLALDPAIPKQNQKMPLLFEAHSLEKLYWRINGGPKILVTKKRLWTPELGHHKFELYEGTQLKHQVSILVK